MPTRLIVERMPANYETVKIDKLNLYIYRVVDWYKINN